jgi:hypothetical protein
MKILDKNEFVNAVKKYFGYLFSSGFEITQISRERRNIIWCILDGHCRINIGSDIEGHVYLSLSTHNMPIEQWQRWYYLEVVVFMLSGKKTNLDYLDGNLDQEFVLKILAGELYKYLERISEIFSEPNLHLYEQEFKALRQEMNLLQVSE